MVVDLGGQASNALTWAYDPPVVLSIQPQQGPPSGDFDVVLSGYNFGPPQAPAVAAINGVDCLNTTRWVPLPCVCF